MAKKPVLSAKALSEEEQAAFYATLSEWKKAKDKAAEYAAKELELRNALVAKYFPNGTEGTNTMTLDYGKALKADIKVNRSVDRAQLNALLEIERPKGEESNILPLLDEVISYDPKVSVSAWKELAPEDKLLLADIITEKPGTPSLSIETPKR